MSLLVHLTPCCLLLVRIGSSALGGKNANCIDINLFIVTGSIGAGRSEAPVLRV